MKKVRVLLADDHNIMRAGLRCLLERQDCVNVVGEAQDGRQTVSLTGTLVPDVVIMDIGMPILNGIEATRQIALKHPNTAVIILSMHSDETYVMRAIKAGARGYLVKDSAETDLVRAIEAVSQGKSFVSSRISRMLLQEHVRTLADRGAEDSYELLTRREREILQLLAEGKTNKDVAGFLNLSLHTVETHRGNILQKLNLHSSAELVLYAVRKGIVTSC